MVEFEPHPEIALNKKQFNPDKHLTYYRYDYQQIFYDIARKKVDENSIYRHTILTDLWFIGHFIMEVPGMNRPFIIDICHDMDSREYAYDAWVQSGYKGSFQWYIDLYARYHYKSTVKTKARTIQRILKYPDKCHAFISYARKAAKKFYQPVMETLERNQVLKNSFRDVLYQDPVKESPKWSENEGLIVKGHSPSRSEATLEYHGIKDDMPVGSHFDFFDLDDLETEDDVKNPEVVQKGRSAIDLSRFLLSEKGVIDITGTPYSHIGIYIPHVINKRKADGTPTYEFIKKPATHDGTLEGTPVMLTQEEWDDLKAEFKQDPHGEYKLNCHAKGTEILMFDFSVKKIEDIVVGDEVIGFKKSNHATRQVKTKVIATKRRKGFLKEYFLDNGESIKCTPDHKWWAGRWKEKKGTGRKEYISFEDKGGNGKARAGAIKMFSHYVAPIPNDRNIIKACSYLGGIFDGEGSFSARSICIFQSEKHNPEVCEKIRESLRIAGFKWSENRSRKSCLGFYIRGGRQENLRFLQWCEITKWKDKILNSFLLSKKNGSVRKKSYVEFSKDIGESDVYNIQTESGNYIANGYASKNCQMLINPTPKGTAKLNSSLLMEIEPKDIPQNLVYFMLIDPAGDDSENKSTGDDWGIWVVGVEPKANPVGIHKRYIINGFLDVLSESAAPELLGRMFMSGYPIRQVGYEYKSITPAWVQNFCEFVRKNGGTLYEDPKMNMVVRLKDGGRQKATRIVSAISRPLNNHCTFISTDVPDIYNRKLREEMDKFGFWPDNGLDALAYLDDIIRVFDFSIYETEINKNTYKQDEEEHEQYNPLSMYSRVRMRR